MDKKLLDYIRCIIELEQSVYIQTKAINKVRGEIKQLGHKNEYEFPSRPHKATVQMNFDSIWTLACPSFVIGGIIGLFFSGFLSGALIGGIGVPLIFYIIDCISVAGTNREREREYIAEKELYYQAVNKDNQRVDQENLEKHRLQEVLGMMIGKCQDTKNLLEKYYSINVIYPKYRNLVAMCSIYGYLESERCEGLTGPHGAYNKFDDDEHWERIYTKLDVVIKRLDQIKDNQYMLYGAIQEGNRISQQIMDNSITQIRLAEKTIENTALGAHYQQQTALETRRTNDLILYDQWQRSRRP